MSRRNRNIGLPERVRKTIDRHQMLRPDQRVLVALSGGLDSVVLLHLLHQMHYDTAAAHFDHQTRDGASKADAAFAQEIGDSMGIPFYCASEPVEEKAREQKFSFEHYARERRYAFLLRTAKEHSFDVVATAHHENDQAETVLMGLLGAASHIGTSGMAPVSVQNAVRLVRPLLEVDRAAIKQWALQQGILWREDHTNDQPCHVRNRIRLEVLPQLEQYNPQIRRTLAQWAEKQRMDDAYWKPLVDALFDKMTCSRRGCPSEFLLDKSAFFEQHETVQRRLIVFLAQKIKVDIPYAGVLRLLDFVQNGIPGKQTDLGKKWAIEIQTEYLRIFPVAESVIKTNIPDTLLRIPGETSVAGYRFQTRLHEASSWSMESIRNQSSNTQQFFDYAQLPRPLRLRSRKPGDRILPLGMSSMKKVQDIMVDCRIPAARRDEVPLLEMEGLLLWVVGCRRAAHAMVTGETQTLLEIQASAKRDGSS